MLHFGACPAKRELSLPFRQVDDPTFMLAFGGISPHVVQRHADEMNASLRVPEVFAARVRNSPALQRDIRQTDVGHRTVSFSLPMLPQ